MKEGGWEGGRERENESIKRPHGTRKEREQGQLCLELLTE